MITGANGDSRGTWLTQSQRRHRLAALHIRASARTTQSFVDDEMLRSTAHGGNAPSFCTFNSDLPSSKSVDNIDLSYHRFPYPARLAERTLQSACIVMRQKDKAFTDTCHYITQYVLSLFLLYVRLILR